MLRITTMANRDWRDNLPKRFMNRGLRIFDRDWISLSSTTGLVAGG